MSVQTDIKLIDNATKVLTGIQREVVELDSIINQLNKKEVLDANKIRDANKEIIDIQKNIKGIDSNISSLGAISGLGGAIGGVIGSIASNVIGSLIDSAKEQIAEFIKWSDTITTTKARLDLINDNLLTTDQLLYNIKNVSLETRTNFTDIADAVGQIRLNTGDLFKNNTEALKFVENLSKSFKITGTDAQGISNAMMQIRQGLSSGVFQGEELNALEDYAPILKKEIADFMNVPIGELKKLGAEGKITADIVKNAILGATEDIDEKFSKLPSTFEDLGTQFKTIASFSFLPLQEELQSIPTEISNNLLPSTEAVLSTLGIISGEAVGFLKDTTQGLSEFIQPMLTPIVESFKKVDAINRQIIQNITGEQVNSMQALQIYVKAVTTFTTTIAKKTGNVLLNLADILVGFVAITIGGFVQITLEGLAKVTKKIDALAGKLGKNLNLTGVIEKDINFIENQNKEFNRRMKEYDNYFKDDYLGKNGTELVQDIYKDATSEVLSITDTQELIKENDTKKATDNINNTSKAIKDLGNSISGLSGASEPTSKNLNDFNKVVMEYREATYHNNVANQFNGNIQIVAYGAGEEEQKAIGKATEDAIRKVFLNDYANTQAMGVYA